MENPNKPLSKRSVYIDNNLPQDPYPDDLIAYQLRPPENRLELYHYVYRVFGVKIPTAKVCDRCISPFEAFAEAYFAEHPTVIWRASRGSGKTYLLALLALTELVTLHAFVALLGGSLEQSKRVHDYIAGKDPSAKGRFMEAAGAPKWLIDGASTQTQTNTVTGGKLVALTASETSVRGPHPQRLRMDEVDVMDRSIYDAATGQAVPLRDMSGNLIIASNLVLSSTHQNAAGTFTYVMDQAREEGFPIRTWCWRETLSPHGWATYDDIQNRKRMMPAHVWEREMEHAEPKAEGMVFAPDIVHKNFCKELGEFRGDLDEECVVEGPLSGYEYYHGVDLAKSKDYSILLTFKRALDEDAPDICVAFKRMGRLSWAYIAHEIERRVEMYTGHCVYDSTGPGKVVEDFLSIDGEGFDFADHKERVKLLSNYVEAFENGRFIFPMISWMHKEHLGLTFQMLYGGANHHLPDTVAAGALANRAKESSGGVMCARWARW